jgi:mannose-6-phosphate isomerase-like protein (cupin superfamily)
MHPAGDELLLMVSGAMTVVLEGGDREELFDLHAGEALIVPRGTWHCQRVLEPGRFFGATYGKGTEHRSI